ncbi:MAG: HigA family addiction module antitoxin [Armatimonadota bacterium]
MRHFDNDLVPAYPSHPGETLKEMLEDRGWTQRQFAEMTGRPIQLINKIINGRSGITAQTALDFAKAFDMSPQFWMDRDSRYRLDMEILRQRELPKAS